MDSNALPSELLVTFKNYARPVKLMCSERSLDIMLQAFEVSFGAGGWNLERGCEVDGTPGFTGLILN
jgi:hypothetical protein